MKRTCDSCGAALADDDRFCGVCGQPHGPTTLPPLTPPPDTLDLSSPANDEPTPPTPYSPAPAPPPRRSHSAILYGLGVVLLLALAGVVGALVASRGSDDDDANATTPSGSSQLPADTGQTYSTDSPDSTPPGTSENTTSPPTVSPAGAEGSESTATSDDTTPVCPSAVTPSVVVDGTAGSAVLIDPGVTIPFEEVRLRVNGSLLDAQQPNRDGSPTFLSWMSDFDDTLPDVGVGAYEAVIDVVRQDGAVVTACPVRFDVRGGALVDGQTTTDPELTVKQLSRDAILRFDPVAIDTYVASGDGPGNLREGYGDTVRAVVVPLVDGRDALLAYQRDKCEAAGPDCADNRLDPAGIERVEIYCGDFAVTDGKADFIFRTGDGHTKTALDGWPDLATTIAHTYSFCGS